MNIKTKVAFCCYLITIILSSIFALIYLFRPEFMPYHATAISMKWSDLNSNLQALILALLRVSGGGMLATSLSISILLFIPFRKGELWAIWAIPIIGLGGAIPTLYATLLVKFNTPASPPWFAAITIIILFLIGFIFSLVSRKMSTNK